MILFILALAIGVGVGFYLPWQIPLIYSKYVSIAIVAALDSLFGGLRAELENNFDNRVFISGFMLNAVIAAFFAYIGDRLGLDLYLAAVVVFGTRIFQNLAIMRRLILNNYLKSRERK
ncbi:MAG: hypothetical protein DDT42_00697 [candidate division WS2 bacterium]|uniref:Small basic protein n=1 Tax=Psychracetigena formicireducens TaxID=2986056 RepID=A0A9E2BFW1_PSYF1|nr:hypothetical protein [Candidatus Psychracetigena formicireducens]MBT9144841.1 hypothetical protein [Candidatus Psychracetigena formicireducens]